MGKPTLRDAGGGGRRNKVRVTTSALVLLLMTMVAGCGLNSPTSSETPGDLTGQNGNTPFVFTGTVVISISSSTVVADDTSTIVVTAEVRDDNGEPISNLTTVLFSASFGGFEVGDPTSPTAQAVSVATFNGIAQALYRSASFGNATITARVGSARSSASVTVDPDPERGTIQLFFLVGGQQLTTTSGPASVASPFVRELNTIVLDPVTGTFQQGVQVRFRIIEDSTLHGPVPGAEFVGPSTSFTDQFGKAVAELRVVGIGDVVVIAEMLDSNTGQVAGTSNQVIATTTAALLTQLTFSDGSNSFTKAVPPSYTAPIIATVTDTSLTAVPGVTVRFSITADTTTAGASLSSSLVVTDANGQATSAVTVPDDAATVGSSVTILAEVIDGNNNVLSTSNIIVAIGT